MSYASLNAFIKVLESKGELIRIREKVSPILEITEITDRMSKHPDGKALLFENNGTGFPLLINAMGSEYRMCLALGCENLDDIGEEIMDLAAGMMQARESLFSKLALLPTLAGVASWMPKRISGRGACQEVVMAEPDLGKLPVLTCWPHDGGPFITLPVVHTRHPLTGQRNVGMYRMQVLDKNTTGMHWHLHKNSASHYREYKQLGQRMPVAVTLGGDPAYTYSATAPLPENVDEYLLAGFLRKKKVELVKCLSCDLEVPADADIVIEGYVDPEEALVLEGPFGDHTGFYSLADFYPRFHVTCITHRKDAVFPATIVGIPPQEDAWIGKATERIFLSPIRLTMLPEIIDMVMPVEGVFHNIVLVKIRKTFPGQAAKVMNALWGAGQMMFNKILIVLDESADLHDPMDVLRAIRENTRGREDILMIRGPMDVLDHSSHRFAEGSKLGIDATAKPGGKTTATSGDNVVISTERLPETGIQYAMNTSLYEAGLQLILVGLVKANKGDVRKLHQELAAAGVIRDTRWVVYVDSEALELGWAGITWLVANNIDPARDSFFLEGDESMAIDGTAKNSKLDEFQREWPNVITMTDEVIRKVDEQWTAFGLGEFIPSPSENYKKLVNTPGAVAYPVIEKN